MADQLCTAAQVKARIGATDAGDDGVIGEVIDQITAEIQSFVGRRLIAEAGATYIVDTAQGHTIRIPRGIRAVSAMGIAALDQPDAGGAYQAVTLADVLLRPLANDRRPGWPPDRVVLKAGPLGGTVPLRTAANGATITGDWDFATPPLFVVRIAVNASVSEFLDRRQAGKAGAEGIDLPGLLNSAELAALARLRVNAGLGIG